LFVDGAARNLHQQMKLSRTPLNQLQEAELCPGSAQLARLNQSLR
jgi:2-oxoglutarate ferredoxin oxidoreductase subunit beta